MGPILLGGNPVTSASFFATTTDLVATLGEELIRSHSEGVCEPFALNVTDECAYVKYFEDACEGGGYARWTAWVVCSETVGQRSSLIAASVLYLFYVLIFLGTATDDYLCTSISAIVEQLKISQSVAGVTFMAFGNGAPDIFGMLVEVVATDTPKARLALGQLLGGGMFITTVIIALVVLHKPFKVMRRPIMRDFVFFLISLLALLWILLYDDRMYFWQPVSLLVLYFVYVMIVVFGGSIREGNFLCWQWETRRMRKRREWEKRKTDRPKMIFTELEITTAPPTPRSTIIEEALSVADTGNASPSPTKLSPLGIPTAKVSPTGLLTLDCAVNTPKLRSMSVMSRRSTIVPVGRDESEGIRHYRDHGKFFADERDTDTEDSDSAAQTPQSVSYIADSLSPSSTASSTPIGESRTERWKRRWRRWRQWDHYGMEEARWYSKLFFFLKSPVLIIFWLCIPSPANDWNKWLTLLHCFTSPLVVLFSFQLAMLEPIDPLPGLWAYSLVFSLIAAITLYFLTSPTDEPRFYKPVVPYVGFVVAVAFVYALAAEAVNVVMVFGVVSQISHVVLGLTVMAWSNCLGDLIADLAVAKQGFSRMAISAAVGGPLLNLLIGFGLSFTIAIAQGKEIEVPRGELNILLMISFLIVSLISSVVWLCAQRFYARRPYAFFLLGLYALFIIVAIILETGIIPL